MISILWLHLVFRFERQLSINLTDDKLKVYCKYFVVSLKCMVEIGVIKKPSVGLSCINSNWYDIDKMQPKI
jgi:hypothetical protein